MAFKHLVFTAFLVLAHICFVNAQGISQANFFHLESKGALFLVSDVEETVYLTIRNSQGRDRTCSLTDSIEISCVDPSKSDLFTVESIDNCMMDEEQDDSAYTVKLKGKQVGFCTIQVTITVEGGDPITLTDIYYRGARDNELFVIPRLENTFNSEVYNNIKISVSPMELSSPAEIDPTDIKLTILNPDDIVVETLNPSQDPQSSDTYIFAFQNSTVINPGVYNLKLEYFVKADGNDEVWADLPLVVDKFRYLEKLYVTNFEINEVETIYYYKKTTIENIGFKFLLSTDASAYNFNVYLKRKGGPEVQMDPLYSGTDVFLTATRLSSLLSVGTYSIRIEYYIIGDTNDNGYMVKFDDEEENVEFHVYSTINNLNVVRIESTNICDEEPECEEETFYVCNNDCGSSVNVEGCSNIDVFIEVYDNNLKDGDNKLIPVPLLPSDITDTKEICSTITSESETQLKCNFDTKDIDPSFDVIFQLASNSEVSDQIEIEITPGPVSTITETVTDKTITTIEPLKFKLNAVDACGISVTLAEESLTIDHSPSNNIDCSSETCYTVNNCLDEEDEVVDGCVEISYNLKKVGTYSLSVSYPGDGETITVTISDVEVESGPPYKFDFSYEDNPTNADSDETVTIVLTAEDEEENEAKFEDGKELLLTFEDSSETYSVVSTPCSYSVDFKTASCEMSFQKAATYKIVKVKYDDTEITEEDRIANPLTITINPLIENLKISGKEKIKAGEKETLTFEVDNPDSKENDVVLSLDLAEVIILSLDDEDSVTCYDECEDDIDCIRDCSYKFDNHEDDSATSCAYAKDEEENDIEHKLECTFTIVKSGNYQVKFAYNDEEIIPNQEFSFEILPLLENLVINGNDVLDAGDEGTFTFEVDSQDQYGNEVVLDTELAKAAFLKLDNVNCVNNCETQYENDNDNFNQCIVQCSDCEINCYTSYCPDLPDMEGCDMENVNTCLIDSCLYKFDNHGDDSASSCEYAKDENENELKHKLECTFTIVKAGYYPIGFIYDNEILVEEDNYVVLHVLPLLKNLIIDGDSELDAGDEGTITFEVSPEDKYNNNVVLSLDLAEVIFLSSDDEDGETCYDECEDDIDCIRDCSYKFDNHEDDSATSCAYAKDEEENDIEHKLECTFTIVKSGNYQVKLVYNNEEIASNEEFTLEVYPLISEVEYEGMVDFEAGKEATVSISVKNTDSYDNNVVLKPSEANIVFVEMGGDKECVAQCDTEKESCENGDCTNYFICLIVNECNPSCFAADKCQNDVSFECVLEKCSFDFENHADDNEVICTNEEEDNTVECKFAITKTGLYLPVFVYREPYLASPISIFEILYQPINFKLVGADNSIAGHHTSLSLTVPKEDKYGNPIDRLIAEDTLLTFYEQPCYGSCLDECVDGCNQCDQCDDCGGCVESCCEVSECVSSCAYQFTSHHYEEREPVCVEEETETGEDETNSIKCTFTITKEADFVVFAQYREEVRDGNFNFSVYHNVLNEKRTIAPAAKYEAILGDTVTFDVVPQDKFGNIIPVSEVDLAIETFQSVLFVERHNGTVDEENNKFTYSFVVGDVNLYRPERSPYLIYVTNYKNESFRSEPKGLEVTYGPIIEVNIYQDDSLLDNREVKMLVGDEATVKVETLNKNGKTVPYGTCNSNEINKVYNGTSISCDKEGAISELLLQYLCEEKKFEFKFLSVKDSECTVRFTFLEDYEEATLTVISTKGEIVSLEAIHLDSYTANEEALIEVIARDINNNIVEIDEDSIFNIEATLDGVTCEEGGVCEVNILGVDADGKYEFTIKAGIRGVVSVSGSLTFTSEDEESVTIDLPAFTFNVVYNDIANINVKNVRYVDENRDCESDPVDDCEIVLGDNIEVEISASNVQGAIITPEHMEDYIIDLCLLCGGECIEMTNVETAKYIFPTEKLVSNCRVRAQITENPNTINEKSYTKLLLYKFNVAQGDVVEFVDAASDDNTYSAVAGEELNFELVALNRNGREINIEQLDISVSCLACEEEELEKNVAGSRLSFGFSSIIENSYQLVVTVESTELHTIDITVSYGKSITLVGIVDEIVAGSGSSFSFTLKNNFNVDIPSSVAVDRLTHESIEFTEENGNVVFTIDDTIVRTEFITFTYDGDVELQYSVNILRGGISEIIVESVTGGVCEEQDLSECNIVYGDEIGLLSIIAENENGATIPVDNSHFYNVDLRLDCGEVTKEGFSSFRIEATEIAECSIVAVIKDEVDSEEYSLVVSEITVVRGDIVEFDYEAVNHESFDFIAGEEVHIVLTARNRNNKVIDVATDEVSIGGCESGLCSIENVQVVDGKVEFVFSSDVEDDYVLSLTPAGELAVSVTYGYDLEIVEGATVYEIGQQDFKFSFQLKNNYDVVVPVEYVIDNFVLESSIALVDMEENNGFVEFALASMDTLGTYTVKVKFGVFEGEFDVEIIRGEIVSVELELLTSGSPFIAGNAVEFSIVEVSNQYGSVYDYLSVVEEIVFTMESFDSNLFSIERTERYGFRMTTEVEGEFVFDKVSISGNDVDVSDFSVTFVPGTIQRIEYILRDEDGNNVEGNTIVAGEEYTLIVLARNENGKYVDSVSITNLENGGIDLEEVSDVSETLNINGSPFGFELTKYTIVVTEAREYVLAFGDNRGVIVGGRYTLNVVANLIDPSTSFASGNGVVQVLRNRVVSFTVTLNDQYMNQVPFTLGDVVITARIDDESIPLSVSLSGNVAKVTYTTPSTPGEYELSVFIYTDYLGTDRLISDGPYQLIVYAPETIPSIPAEIGPNDSYEVNGDNSIDETVEVSGTLSFNEGSNTTVDSSFFDGSSPLIRVLEGGEVNLDGTLEFMINSREDLHNLVKNTTVKRDERAGATIVIVEGVSTGEFEPVITNNFNSCVIVTASANRENVESDYVLTISYSINEECIEVKEESLKAYAITGVVLGVLLLAAIIAIVILVILWKKPFSKKGSSAGRQRTRSHELRNVSKQDADEREDESSEQSNNEDISTGQESSVQEEEESSAESEQEDSSEGSVQEESSEGSAQEESSEGSAQEESSEGSSSSQEEEES